MQLLAKCLATNSDAAKTFAAGKICSGKVTVSDAKTV